MYKKFVLQTEIDSDEEYNTFLKQDGLLDIYSDFFGPCTGMVGVLSKIKAQDGFENLHFAICKSDNITALAQYRNSSLPTWIFMKNGKAVNFMSGADRPKLEQIINYEISKMPTITITKAFEEALPEVTVEEYKFNEQIFDNELTITQKDNIKVDLGILSKISERSLNSNVLETEEVDAKTSTSTFAVKTPSHSKIGKHNSIPMMEETDYGSSKSIRISKSKHM